LIKKGSAEGLLAFILGGIYLTEKAEKELKHVGKGGFFYTFKI